MHPQDQDSYTAPTLTILLSLIIIVGAAIAALINLYI